MNLNELFLTHKGTRSYDDLERACGRELTSQRLQQIATTPPKEFPKAKNIKAIARALGISEAVVVLAAAESLGLDVSRELPRLVQVLPSTASDLSDEEVAALAHVIRAFKREDVMGNAEHPAPNTGRQLAAARTTGRMTAEQREAEAKMHAAQARRQEADERESSGESDESA